MTFDAETEALIERTRAEWESVEGRERLWRWFALTRASWLTVPRVLMHEMPEEWQGQMARLLEQFDEAFPEWCQQQLYVMAKEKGRFTSLPDALCDYRHPDQAAIASFRPKRDIPA